MFIIGLFLLLVVAGVTVAFAAKQASKGKSPVKTIVCGVLVAVISLIGSNAFKSVPTGATGVVTTFGKVEDMTLEAGIHVLNPFSKVINMNNRTQKATVSLSAFSSDIQEVSTIYTLNFCVDKANAQKLYKEIGVEYYDTVIVPKVAEAVKSVMAQYSAENLVSSRGEVSQKIEEQLKTSLAKYNIEVVATAIEDMDFTDAFTDAVEAKQVAEQNKLKATTEAETAVIKAQAEADVKLIEAEATAKANDLLTESLTDEILRKQAVEKWDGKMPTVISNGSEILDLTGLTN